MVNIEYKQKILQLTEPETYLICMALEGLLNDFKKNSFPDEHILKTNDLLENIYSLRNNQIIKGI